MANPRQATAAKPNRGEQAAARKQAPQQFRDDLAAGYEPRLRKLYRERVRGELKEQLGLSNVMQVPCFEKITINMGLGEAVRDNRLIEVALRDLETLSGQKPVVTKARKSIAGFKLRAGMPIGAKVTLRGNRMWEFFDRLMSIVIPRIRDFRGLNPNSFDGRGNYTMGVKEQLIFPEIEYDKVERTLGMDITFSTTATDDNQGYALLRAFGFPFADRNSAEG